MNLLSLLLTLCLFFENRAAPSQNKCPSFDRLTPVYFPDQDCSKFWQCSNGVAYQHVCSAPLHFNPNLNVCDFPQNVKCASESPSSASKDLPESGENKCPAVDGPISVYFPDQECSKFWQCSNGVAYQHDCPANLHFNPRLNLCDFPENAKCVSKNSSEAPRDPENGGIECPAVDGPNSVYFPDQDCTKFWQCSNGVAYQHGCPANLHFNPLLNVCDHPEHAGCIKQKCPAVDGPMSVYFADQDCTKFWQCSNGHAYQHKCPGNLHFNPTLNVCDYPEKAGCAVPNETKSTVKPNAQTTTPKITTISPTPANNTTTTVPSGNSTAPFITTIPTEPQTEEAEITQGTSSAVTESPIDGHTETAFTSSSSIPSIIPEAPTQSSTESTVDDIKPSTTTESTKSSITTSTESASDIQTSLIPDIPFNSSTDVPSTITSDITSESPNESTCTTTTQAATEITSDTTPIEPSELRSDPTDASEISSETYSNPVTEDSNPAISEIPTDVPSIVSKTPGISTDTSITEEQIILTSESPAEDLTEGPSDRSETTEDPSSGAASVTEEQYDDSTQVSTNTPDEFSSDTSTNSADQVSTDISDISAEDSSITPSGAPDNDDPKESPSNSSEKPDENTTEKSSGASDSSPSISTIYDNFTENPFTDSGENTTDDATETQPEEVTDESTEKTVDKSDEDSQEIFEESQESDVQDDGDRKRFKYICKGTPTIFFLSPHPNDCNLYIACDHGKIDILKCPDNMHFNPNIYVCDYPADARCQVN